jgi:hypothetical protein
MLNDAAAKIVAPSPPPRKPSQRDGFDLDAVLTARAQKLLASGTHREFQSALRQQAADSSTVAQKHKTAVSLEPVKPAGSLSSSTHGTPSKRRARLGDGEVVAYSLEWDPRAIPLLTFAESEARRALIHREYEYRIALAAAIHSTMIQVFYTCHLDDLEQKDEVRQRRIIGAMERQGRTILWEAQEELIITQQLRELDIPKEEIVQYLHRHDQGDGQETEGGLLSGVSAVSEARRRRANKSSSPPASPQQRPAHTEKHNTQEEWVLGIAYLITFDLSMEERKFRLATLREEFHCRELLVRQRDQSKEAVLVAYRNRRHGERCDHYRQQRYEQVSQEMYFEHACAPLFEEWMLITHTLMATACLMEHHLQLSKRNAEWRYHVATDNLHQLKAQEHWHRSRDMMTLYQNEREWLWREHYIGRILALVDEERREFDSTLAPWIANSKALVQCTSRRLQSTLTIQIWYRSIRHGLSGWHATHKRLGADIKVLRRRRHRNSERATTLGLLEKLEQLEQLQ